MFCPNCGNDCADANFCPMCGTKLPQKSEEGQVSEQRVWEIPVGEYKTYGGHIALGLTCIEVHKKKNLKAKNHTVRFPYTQLTGVSYGRNHGLDGGFAAVRWEGNRDLPIPKNFSEALWDSTSIQTDSPSDLLFYHICCFLYTFVNPSSGNAPVYARECYDDLPSMEQGLSSYYEKYNPYRADAVEALRENTGITRKEAARLIDAYFDKRQKAEYAEDASAALRDLNKILRIPKSTDIEQNSPIKALDLDAYYKKYYPNKANAIAALRIDTGMGFPEAKKCIDAVFARYAKDEDIEHDPTDSLHCPKCFSGSVFCGKKGFDFATGWLAERILPGRGFMLGALNSNKLQCKCLNCGHTWEP